MSVAVLPPVPATDAHGPACVWGGTLLDDAPYTSQGSPERRAPGAHAGALRHQAPAAGPAAQRSQTNRIRTRLALSLRPRAPSCENVSNVLGQGPRRCTVCGAVPSA